MTYQNRNRSPLVSAPFADSVTNIATAGKNFSANLQHESFKAFFVDGGKFFAKICDEIRFAPYKVQKTKSTKHKGY